MPDLLTNATEFASQLRKRRLEMTSIADFLAIPQKDRAFTFEGRDFEYHAPKPAFGTIETLFSRWAGGSRSVSATPTMSEDQLKQSLAALLSHRLRNLPRKEEWQSIIDAARASLAETGGESPGRS